VLTGLSEFWFQKFSDIENHFITSNREDLPDPLKGIEDLDGRFMIVKKLDMVPVECVVRGYLVGSGFREYKQEGRICNIDLPDGLQLADRLPEPIFTPAAKAQSGHDENISFDVMVSMVGADLSQRLRNLSLDIYRRAAAYALERDVIIADTKFEFGLLDGQIVLADEVLTPDSSRYWPRASYRVGANPPSFDKQFVRDYLDQLAWDKNNPAPTLPSEIVEGTARRYQECLELLTINL